MVSLVVFLHERLCKRSWEPRCHLRWSHGEVAFES